MFRLKQKKCWIAAVPVFDVAEEASDQVLRGVRHNRLGWELEEDGPVDYFAACGHRVV